MFNSSNFNGIELLPLCVFSTARESLYIDCDEISTAFRNVKTEAKEQRKLLYKQYLGRVDLF